MASDVVVDLFPDEWGRYAADLRIGPGKPWANVAAQSATIHVGGEPNPEPGAHRLVFHPAVPSSIGSDALLGPPALTLVYIYRADRAAILEFDRRITARYTSYFATIGEQYSGTFDVDGLPEPCIGEFSVLDAPTADAWKAHQASVDMPQDVVDIVTECVALQDRSFERFAIWLTPRA